MTRTQTVKILDTGYITYYEYKKIKNKAKTSKVKRMVGGTGKVVDRYSLRQRRLLSSRVATGTILIPQRRGLAKRW